MTPDELATMMIGNQIRTLIVIYRTPDLSQQSECRGDKERLYELFWRYSL